MGKRMRKLKNVRLHREGTDTLFYGLLVLVAVAMVLWIYVDSKAIHHSVRHGVRHRCKLLPLP